VAQVGSTGGDYFSNESAGAPLGMDEKGIFFQVEVDEDARDQCLQFDLRGQTIDRKDSVILDGTAGTLDVLTFRNQEVAPGMQLNILHGGYCYKFVFISWSVATRDSYEEAATRILGSFRFGAGPVPTP
jgi:hypothetical protein